jgi:pheromone shutdown protein TraB
LSTNVTVKEQAAVLPATSVAVALTVVVPTANVLPLAGLLTTLEEQLSVVVTVNETGALQAFKVLFTLILAGQAIVGFVLSTTVTVDVHVLWLLFTSRTVRVTVLGPRLAHVKLLGLTVNGLQSASVT